MALQGQGQGRTPFRKVGNNMKFHHPYVVAAGEALIRQEGAS